jgi:TonB-dependent receptor
MKSNLKFCTQTAVAALLLGATGVAYAQDTGAQEVVTVTGFRASLQNALDLKKSSNLIIESVTAEDVGKMPDKDVAESLQRLPGVQIDRAQGRGTAVLIDGLRQNLTTLNGDVFLTGREFYVSGEGSGGGAGGNSQYASLEGIPSEEIGRVDVYKSPNASLTEGGLGGIIDLRSRDAIDSPEGFSLAVNLSGTSTSKSTLGNMTPSATIVASLKPSSAFAITGSLSYDDESTHTNEYESYNRSPWLITAADVKGYAGVGPMLPATTITNSTTPNPTFNPACPSPTISAVFGPTCPAPATNTPFLAPFTSGYTANSGQGSLPGGASYLLPEYSYFSDLLDKRKVYGETLGVTWQPSDSFKSSLNFFFSQVQERQTNYSTKVGFNGSGSSSPSTIPGAGPAGINADKPYTIDGNGVVQSATFWLNGSETATLYQKSYSQADNVQWHNVWDNGGPLTGTLDVAWAHANAKLQAAQQDVEHGYYGATGTPGSAAPLAPGCNNFSPSCAVGSGNPAFQVAWTNGGSSGLPTAVNLAPYADVLSNAQYTLFKSAWAWANQAQQTEEAIRGALVYKPAFLGSVDGTLTGGFRVAKRDINQTFGRYLINRESTPGVVGSNCCFNAATSGNFLYYQDPGYDSQIPWDTAVSNPALVKTVNNFALGPIMVKDPVTGGMTNPATFLSTVWNNAHHVPVGSTLPNNSEQLFTDTLSSFKVKETTEAGYLMADFGGKDDRYHVNLGVRLIKTDLTVDGAQTAPVPHYVGTASWNGVNSNNIPVTNKSHYWDLLPSLNVMIKVTDEQIVRLSAARVVAPQDLYSLGLGNSYNFTRETGGRTNIHTGVKDGFKFATGNSGNPQLDPYRASQFNLSWEDYFAPGGLVSAGVFYKAVDNFVETQNITTTVMDDFGGTSGTISMPVNAGHGSIYGLELAAQYAFEMGFGLAGNYTRTESTSDQVTAFTNSARIPGVSTNSFTGTAYYENAGFGGRLSYSWRDSAVNDGLGGSTFSVTDTMHGGAPKIFGVFTAPYGELDGQLSYNFTENYGIVVSAQNLTNQAVHTYLQYKNMPFTYDQSGTRYFFGIKASY